MDDRPTLPLLRDHVYQGDCVEVLSALPAQSVDLISVDPPWHAMAGTTGTPRTRAALWW